MSREVKGQVPARGLQSRAAGSVGFAPIREQTIPEDRVTNFMGTLSKVLPAASELLTAEFTKQAETDALLQENRAALGLEPTEDATNAGVSAHKAVTVRNAAMDAAAALQEEAKTFEGTDEDWEMHIAEKQRELLDAVGEDPEAVKAAGKVFQDKYASTALTRYAAKQEQQQIATYNTGMDSLQLATDRQYSPAQIRVNLGQAIEEMKAMGATDALIKKTITDAAIAQAETDDLTLIDYSKELGLYQQEPGLVKAERAAQSRITGTMSGEIAIAKQTAVDRLSIDEGMTFEQWAMYAGSVKEPTGQDAFSESEIRSIWEKQQKGMDEAFEIDRYWGASMARMVDEGVTPVGMYDLSKKQTAALVNKYDTVFGAREMGEISKASTPEEQVSIKTRYKYEKAKWLSANGIKDEKWSAMFSTLENFDGTLQEQKLPVGVANALALMDDLSESPGAIQNHATDKQIAIHENFKNNLSFGLSETVAYQEAWKMAQKKPVELRGDDRKKFDSAVRSAVNSSFESSWLGRTFAGSNDNASEQQRGLIGEQVGMRARMLLNAGVKEDMAVARAMSEFNDTHFQLSNGSVIFGDKNNIARQMGVATEKVDGLIAAFPTHIVELASEPGFESAIIDPSVPPEEWIPTTTANGRITFTDKWGNRVTRIFDLSEVGGVSLSEKAKQIQGRQEELRKERLKDLETRKRTINQFGINASNWITN